LSSLGVSGELRLFLFGELFQGLAVCLFFDRGFECAFHHVIRQSVLVQRLADSDASPAIDSEFSADEELGEARLVEISVCLQDGINLFCDFAQGAQGVEFIAHFLRTAFAERAKMFCPLQYLVGGEVRFCGSGRASERHGKMSLERLRRGWCAGDVAGKSTIFRLAEKIRALGVRFQKYCLNSLHKPIVMPLPYRSGNRIELIRGGADFFEALYALIECAEMSLHIQVYTLEQDETGLGVIERLKAAARRGVQVYVVLDAFGSQALSEAVLQELRAEGIWIRKYSPIFRGIRFRIGQRLHHKVMVADQQLALTGGINLADKYRGVGEAAWLDYAVRIRGPLCQDLLRYCRRFWPSAQRLRMPVFSPADKAGEAAARISRNDLRMGMQEITETYRRAIGGAAREVLLLSPYFIPGLRLRKALAAARKRGVRVTLIVPGISDVPMIQRAMEYLYDWLLEIGVEVWEWNQSILHGKVLVVDGQWVSIGSYNPNALSDYFSLELNADIRDPRFAGRMQAELTELILPQCTALTAVKIRSRFTWMRRLAQSVSYYLLWAACRLAIPDVRLLRE